MPNVFEVADRISVMRLGRRVGVARPEAKMANTLLRSCVPANAGDSRSIASMIGARISGATPPATNIQRQCDDSSDMLIRLASAPPNGAPL